MWSSIKMVLWFAMHQFLISTFHQNEKYQKNRNLQPKNVSRKCGPRKKGISDEQEEELLDEILDSLDDEQVEEDD